MTIYRADPPAARLAIEMEGMTILYHRPSGTTHVLLPPAPQLLLALDEGPADATTLAARLGVADEADAVDILSARLRELAIIGLVAVQG